VGLEDRLVTHFDSHRITELCASPIDWNAVGRRIRAFSEIGSAFLTKALSATDVPLKSAISPVKEAVVPGEISYE
jgi:hypothetical protein